MNLYLIGHDYRYAAEQMLLTLFPDERPVYPGRPADRRPRGAAAHVRRKGDDRDVRARLSGPDGQRPHKRAQRGTDRPQRDRPAAAGCGQARVLPRGHGHRPAAPAVGHAHGCAPRQAHDPPARAGHGRCAGRALFRAALRRRARARRARRTHRPRDAARHGLARRKGRVPVRGHPVLPDALRLLQLCEPVGGKEHGARAGVSAGARARDRGDRRGRAPRRSARRVALHRRRHADHALGAPARRAVHAARRGIRPQRPARVHRRGRPARHHHGRQAARAARAPGRPHQRQPADARRPRARNDRPPPHGAGHL